MSGPKQLLVAGAFIFLALGMAPLNAIYLKNLWAEKHYQFFPVLLAAVALLLVSRWRMNDAEAGEVVEFEHDQADLAPLAGFWSGLRPIVALGTVALGIAIEFAAIWAFPLVTPWGGYFGLLIAGLGAALYLSDGRQVSLVPAWLLMALILMPPENRDDQLIAYLQQSTAAFTSQLLDFLGVDHIREGVLIEIDSRKLFVEEACSGVQSLFSLLAVAAVLAVWNHRSLVHTLLLFLAAIAGAGGTNVLRTVSIVYGLDRVGIDLLAEPQHSILGVIVFIAAIGWLLCCDAFLLFLLRPIDSVESQPQANIWITLWNRLIAGFRWIDEPPVMRRGPVTRMVCGVALAAIGVSSGALAVASTKAVLASQREGIRPLLAPVDEGQVIGKLATLDEDSFPPQFEGWTRVRFEPVQRTEGHSLGQHSRTWGYSTPCGLATISVDYPFRGWHDLQLCYQAAGWIPSAIRTASTAGGHGVVDITQFSLQKYTGEAAVVVFAAMNEKLEPVPTREGSGAAQTFIHRIRKAVSATDNTDVVAQFQILLQPARPLTESDLEDLHRHLNLVKSRLLEHLRASGEVTP